MVDKPRSEPPFLRNMHSMRTQSFRIRIGIGIWVVALLSSLYQGSCASLPSAQGQDSSEAFFSSATIPILKLVLDAKAIQTLRTNPREAVEATLSDGTQSLSRVGVHLKGMGSFRAVDDKPSFSIKLNQFVEGQSYFGMTKLMLNNSVQDPSYMAEFLGTALFRDAGVPAARVRHVRVFLNGKDLGLYLAIEGMNKRFLKRFFEKANGNLYEGYLVDVNAPLDQDGGESRDQSDIRALYRAAQIEPARDRFIALGKVLDLDRFASFAAMEVLLSHWDGYCIHTNNYRIYHDPKTDKMVFIAHGLDGLFHRPNISIRPPIKSVVSRALFTTEEGKALYERRLAELNESVFRTESITHRLNAAMDSLRNAGLSSADALDLESKVTQMRQRVIERTARVREQLSGVEPKPLSFPDSNWVSLKEWREEPDIGHPLFNRTEQDQHSTLHILSQEKECRASWRTSLYLKPGRYQLEGQVRTRGMTAGGAGLRISGDTRNRRVGGDSDWQLLVHPFEVKEGEGDVEMVCEMRTYRGGGEVWFDLGTLGLRKRP